MATSTKVKFRLETLQEKAIEAIDLRIARAQLKVDSAESEEAFQLRVQRWRGDTETKIIQMSERLRDESGGRVEDYELDKFRSRKLKSMPEQDRWEMRDAERDLELLKATKSQIEAKSAALVPDEDGNVALTTTQLAQFFAL